MTVKHTPAPWAVNPFKAQVDAFNTGEPIPVCQMLWPTDLRREDETYANANLIAAAPELMAALEEAITIIEFFHGKDAWEIYRDKSPEMKRIRAVIAKAKGCEQ